MAQPLRLARVQDAVAWLCLAAVLLAAPLTVVHETLGLPRPDPPLATVLAGALLIVAALALLRSRGPAPVMAAAIADLAAATAILVWILTDDPATRWRGTAALAIVAAGLALQSAVDATLLLVHGPGPTVDSDSDRPSER